MTIEDQIAELLAQAEPLRALPDEIAEAKGLPSLVDRINRLRLLQSQAPQPYGMDEEQRAVATGIEAAYGRAPNPGEVEFFQPAKRGPGRPKKAE